MNSIFTELCAWSAMFLALAAFALIAYWRASKERITAAKDKGRAEILYGEIPDYDASPTSYITKVNVDEHYAYVAGFYLLNNSEHGEVSICIKKFPYDVNDESDLAFAISEAEELKDKLREK